MEDIKKNLTILIEINLHFHEQKTKDSITIEHDSHLPKIYESFHCPSLPRVSTENYYKKNRPGYYKGHEKPGLGLSYGTGPR